MTRGNLQKIAIEATKRGVFSLDAPVSGGDVGARNGTLSVMVGQFYRCILYLQITFLWIQIGGDKDAVDLVRPMLDAMSKKQ